MNAEALGAAVESGEEFAKPLLLGDPGAAWGIEAGAVDLFFVRTEMGIARGARRPVTRLEAGATLFGMAEGAYGMLAHPLPGTRLSRVNAYEAGVAAMELWVTELSAAASAGRRCAGEFALLNGRVARLAPGAAAYPAAGVCWVQVAGRCRWLGVEGAELFGGGAAFPVAATGWVEAAEELDVAPGEASAEGLAAFNELVIEVLARRAAEEEESGRGLIRKRVEADRAQARGARRILAGAAGPADGVGEDRNPLVEALRLAAAELGLTVSMPPASARADRNPIEAIARASGFRVRKVALRKGWEREDSGPMVASWAEGNEPVALIPKGAGSYELRDPARGARRRVTGGVAGQLGPFGYSLYRPFPPTAMNALSLIAFGMRGLKRDAVTIGAAAALAGVLGTAVPLANRALFDSIIPGANRPQLWQMFWVLCGASTAVWLLGVARALTLQRVEAKMDYALQAGLWDRLISLPAAFHRAYTAGDLASRSLGITVIRETLTGHALNAALTSIFSVFSFALMFSLSPAMAVPATGLVALAFVVALGVASIQIRLQRRLAEQAGRMAGYLPQMLGGITKIRVLGIEERVFARWAARFMEQKRLGGQSRTLGTKANVVLTLFQAASTMAIFALLPRGDGGAAMTTGAFLAFQAAFAQVLGGASVLSSTLLSVLSVIPTYERSLPILQTAPEVNRNRTDPGALSGDIELSHVAFRYQPELPPILRDVCLRIRAGEFVAVVGGTGSGKSTLIRLLLGFETPETGSIFYDGKDMAGLDVQALRRQIGVVLQHGVLMGGDLFSAIAGASPLTIDDAWEAARGAGLEEDIRNMPMGMHTVIPDGGLGLSGGQRQRLHIARALALKPRIMIFDEATSALDNQTQAVVMESLDRLKGTRIVIAHRLSTIRNADRIVVLNRGVVEEEGTFDELMARGGFFATLASRQVA